MSEAHKKRYSDPAEREKTREQMRAAFSTPEARKRLSDIRKETLKDPREIEKLQKASEARWQDRDVAIAKQKAAMEKWMEDPEYRAKLSRLRKEKALDPEWRANISKKLIDVYKNEEMRLKRSGENAPNWRGGKSYEPYCHKFNKKLKEDIRERFHHTCFICGGIQNGRKFPIHHIDYNKNTLCNGKTWPLIPLCDSCHTQTNYNRWYWFNLLINYWLNNSEIHFRRFEICSNL